MTYKFMYEFDNIDKATDFIYDVAKHFNHDGDGYTKYHSNGNVMINMDTWRPMHLTLQHCKDSDQIGQFEIQRFLLLSHIPDSITDYWSYKDNQPNILGVYVFVTVNPQYLVDFYEDDWSTVRATEQKLKFEQMLDEYYLKA